MPPAAERNLTCPVTIRDYPNVLMAHGGGGTLMHELIEKIFAPTLMPDSRLPQHDAAVIALGNVKIAFTTDSYVVHPLFFPGGDIGSLAVHGTVNDLAVSGARALYLSAGFILEEGLPMATLWRVVQSMKAAADEAGVQVITGDTKVVDKGKGDGLYINTTGVGIIEHDRAMGPGQVQCDDVLVLSGDLGRHGIAIMVQREGLRFESEIESDSTAVGDLIYKLLDAGIGVHCMRDLTRGGLASALNEIASAANVGIQIDEASIPIRNDVRGACEILGLDPLYVACEGRFIAFIAPGDVEAALTILRSDPKGENANVIGNVTNEQGSLVTMVSRIGTSRIVDMLSGEQLPRIC